MTPVNLIITLPELERVAEALEALAQSKATQAPAPAATVVSAVPAPAAPAVSSTPATLTEPVAAPAAEKAYTLDELISAATKLVDGDKREELRTLLEMLGAQSLAMLPPDKYAAFAEGLRKLGADL